MKDVNGKFDDYSISPIVRQNLLYWGYELTEKDFFINIFLLKVQQKRILGKGKR